MITKLWDTSMKKRYQDKLNVLSSTSIRQLKLPIETIQFNYGTIDEIWLQYICWLTARPVVRGISGPLFDKYLSHNYARYKQPRDSVHCNTDRVTLLTHECFHPVKNHAVVHVASADINMTLARACYFAQPNNEYCFARRFVSGTMR